MKQKTAIHIANAWICQVKQNSLEPIFGDLIIREQKIAEIHPIDFRKFISNERKTGEHAFNAGGRVITIPLVNFHDHFYSRLAKGLPLAGAMESFSQILENLWWKLDKALDLDMIEACAEMAALESIRQGVTYIFDHHSSPARTTNSLEVIAHKLQEYGLRGVLCFETSDRNGDDLAQAALDECQRFTAKSVTDDIKAMLGLHASFTLSDVTLSKAAELLGKLNLGIHIHLCEAETDRKISLEKFRNYPVQRLMRFNLMNRKSILSHGVHLNENDYSIISQAGSAIAYNPDSNLNNAVGLPEFHKMPEQIPILIGTDGMHANIARSIKQLFLLYRHQNNSFDNAFRWIKKIYFDQLNFIQQYFPDFTRLSRADRADFIIWDYIPPTPLSSNNFWGHFIYGILEYQIHSVIQDGRFLMKNKVIRGEDQARIRIYQQGEKLFNHFQNSIFG
jgi:cytosine/adenosine deaminase-related metal-dependent hydrolase